MTVNDTRGSARALDTASEQKAEELQGLWSKVVGRRSFLRQAGLASAAAVPASAVVASAASARARQASTSLTTPTTRRATRRSSTPSHDQPRLWNQARSGGHDQEAAGDSRQRHGHVPTTTAPVPPTTRAQQRIQAIANTAGFHFAMIEQGGSSLYTTMSLKATSLEVLRIVVAIGGVETNHFSLWHDKCGNAVSPPLGGVVTAGLFFPNLNAQHSEEVRALTGEPVLVARRSLLIFGPVEDSGLHQPLEADLQNVPGDAQLALELVEPAGAQKRLADDQDRPPFSDQLQRASDRAVLVGVIGGKHSSIVGGLSCLTQLT